MSEPDLGLWDFSLRIYGRPGVEPACLDLQDRLGLDVDLILCACWLGRRGVRLGPERLAALEAAAAPWREAAVLPLRALRRNLKPALAGLPDDAGLRGGAAAVRERVKAVELAAERVELQLLAQLAGAWPVDASPEVGTVAANLAGFAAFGPADRGGLGVLLAAVCPEAAAERVEAALSRLTGAPPGRHGRPSGGPPRG